MQINCKAPAITEEQRGIADSFINSFNNLCLISGFYRGEPVAFVGAVDKQDNEVIISPLFIVVTGEMHKSCLGPMGESFNEESAVPKQRLACPHCNAINAYRIIEEHNGDLSFSCRECGNNFTSFNLVIESSCPYCGRSETDNEYDNPHWFSPCPADDCPSHDEDKTQVEPSCCGGVPLDKNGKCPICGDSL